jgi:muconolactone D-isomerase
MIVCPLSAELRSIFDVDSSDELHELLSGLPLFRFMDIKVMPLATQPSDVKA